MALSTVSPPASLFRVSRSPNPWAWPDWRYAGPDNTFGNRWDDPGGMYRVLYAGSSLHGCFVEVLSRYRKSAAYIAGLAAIPGPPTSVPPGVVPRSWLHGRAIGEATPAAGRYVNVGHSDTLTHLHTALAHRLVHHKIPELDAAAIRQKAPREFTQEISSYLFKQTDGAGTPSFAGIAYPSRFGDEFPNWAIFERPGFAGVTNAGTRPITPDDPDFLAALATLDLSLEP